ncbi:type II toxin-antitoxin system RelE/ParE family toxin [Bacillus tianshenii]|nr:type II toxin-antitoxin system RelE/ParE family toxin [Bacillus tianshenii]
MDHLIWETLEYEKENGEIPVQTFLNSLPAKQASKVVRDLELLESFGPRWGEPQVKYISDGIYELRTKQGSNIFRTFFFRWLKRKGNQS